MPIRELRLLPMGLAHCPLCVALAVFCVLRSAAHAVQLWQLRPAVLPPPILIS